MTKGHVLGGGGQIPNGLGPQKLSNIKYIQIFDIGLELELSRAT